MARRRAVAARVGVRDGEERRFFAWALTLLAPKAGASLLDVACGAGAFAEFAAGARAARHRDGSLGRGGRGGAGRASRARSSVAGDAEALPFEDGAFDHVTCLGSLEHFPHPEAGAAEMRRVLAPGGRAVVFVPNLFFLGHIWFGLRHGQQPTEGGQGFSEEYLSSGGWRALLRAQASRSSTCGRGTASTPRCA